MTARINEDLVANYIAENIAAMDLAASLRTTVAAGAGNGDAGNSQVIVADASHFVMQGTAMWWDGSGEDEIGVKSVDLATNTLTFDRPLQYDHDEGAVLSTNIYDYAPDMFGFQLRKGDPVIFAEVVRSRPRWKGMKLVTGPMFVHIQYTVLDEQPDGEDLHPNLWVKEQKRRCKVALSDILEASIKNNHLRTPTREPIAIRVGNDTSDEIAEVAYDQWVLSKEDVPVFAAATQLIVIPRPMTK